MSNCCYIYSGIILALKCFDGTGGGITVGVIILLIAVMFGTAAGIDLLLISKVSTKSKILHCSIFIVSCGVHR